MNPQIITTKAIAKKTSTAFCLPVSLASLEAVFLASSAISSCSCKERNVEPLSALTFLAYLNTKNNAIRYEEIQRIAPSAMIVPELIATPESAAVDIAIPVANGLIVEPKTPTPAPSNTTAAPTRVSIPAATIVVPSSR